MLAWIDRAFDAVFRVAQWLAVPIVVLLFLQWPLREQPGGLSRAVNDVGQILFAIYVAVALTAATRSGSHIVVDAVARHYDAHVRRTLQRICSAAILVPWASFVAWTSAPMALDSLRQLERFQDTANPGYFLIRCAVLLLAVLVVAAGVVDAVRGGRGR